MYTSDKKILELIDVLKTLGKINSGSEFCESIGFLKQNIVKVKNDLAHFTPQHIEKICSVYGVNCNWIFSLEPNIFRKQKAN